eukprot:2544907-Rhodomonas_salina.1
MPLADIAYAAMLPSRSHHAASALSAAEAGENQRDVRTGYRVARAEAGSVPRRAIRPLSLPPHSPSPCLDPVWRPTQTSSNASPHPPPPCPASTLSHPPCSPCAAVISAPPSLCPAPPPPEPPRRKSSRQHALLLSFRFVPKLLTFPIPTIPVSLRIRGAERALHATGEVKSSSAGEITNSIALREVSFEPRFTRATKTSNAIPDAVATIARCILTCAALPHVCALCHTNANESLQRSGCRYAIEPEEYAWRKL